MKTAWATRPLVELCDFFADGDWVESKDQSPNGIRLIQTGNVGVGTFKDRAEKARYISEQTFTRLRCTEVLGGDCLISRLPEPVGRSCILPHTGERMITAVDCTIVRFDPKQYLPAFFNLYAQSDQYFSAVAKECTGTTRTRISRSNLGLTPVPVPPLAEQQRIVKLLDEAFADLAAAKAHAERNLENASTLIESYLQTLFKRKDKGWKDQQLQAICREITVGHVGPMKTRYKKSGVPFLRSQNIHPFEVSTTNLVFIDDAFHRSLRKSQLRPGDLAIVRTGYPGTAAVVPPSLPDSNCSDLVIVRPSMEANPHFLAAFFNSAFGKRLVLGKIVGAAQKHFNVTAAKEVTLRVPPIGEQERIVETIDAFRAETRRLEGIYKQRLAALDALKKSLVHQAFSGAL